MTDAEKQELLELRAWKANAGSLHRDLHVERDILVMQNEVLARSVRWFIAQFQGDSGTGHSHWEQFPEYRIAVHALSLREKQAAQRTALEKLRRKP